MRLLHKQIICLGPKLNFNNWTAKTLPRTVDRRMLLVSKACYCNSKTNFSTHNKKKTKMHEMPTSLCRCLLHATVFLRLSSFAAVEEIRHSISHCCSHNLMCESQKTQGHRYSKAHGFSNFCWISAKMFLGPIQRSRLNTFWHEPCFGFTCIYYDSTLYFPADPALCTFLACGTSVISGGQYLAEEYNGWLLVHIRSYITAAGKCCP